MHKNESKHYKVREVEHCWIPMSDEVRLSARLWLPETLSGKPIPAILEYIPYRKRDMVRLRDERNHPYFARHGYACVRVDMRGSGDSEGLMTDMYSPAELDDAVAVLNWIACQPWCDGNVGMMGTSWGGTASLQAATRRPPVLKAIIAVCATNNRFEDDIHHMGGCLLTDTVEWGATLPAILALPPDPETVGPAWRQMWQQRLENLGFALENWVRHETRDDYWRWGSVNETADPIDCPMLAVGGWVDRYSNTVMNLLAQNRDRCWGIIGPWGHHYPDVGCPGPGLGFQQEAVRWWDRWLKGAKNGVDQAPRLRVWLQEYTEPRDKINERPGRWISERAWPSNNVGCRRLWCAPSGLQSMPSENAGTGTVPFALQVGRTGGDTGYFGRAGGLAPDQRDDDAYSLTFDSDPLPEPIDILGSACLTVHAASDVSVATLVARLNDVAPGGQVARVSYAVRNLALNQRGEKELPAPNETREYRIAFPNTAYRFDKGHIIRLALSSTYWPIIWPSPTSARITLRLAQTHITLPVRGAKNTDEVEPFAAPVATLHPNAHIVTAPPLERHSTPIDATGKQCIEWHQPFTCTQFNEIGLTFAFETHATHTIDIDDPCSAHTKFEHRLHFARDEMQIVVTGTAELRSTPTAYHVIGSLVARENGTIVFSRKWKPVIPRSC